MNKFTHSIRVYVSIAILALFAANARAQTYCIPHSYYGGDGGSMQYTAFSTTGGVQNITYNPGAANIPNNFSAPSYYNNASEGYSYVTTTQAVAAPGTAMTFTIHTSSTYSMYYFIWVDWNGTGSFTQAGDTIQGKAYTLGTGSGTNINITGSFTVPGTASPGVKRLRISASYVDATFYPMPAPCLTYTSANECYYMVWTDFNFIVQAPCSVTPIACSITNNAAGTLCAGTQLALIGSDPNTAFTGISYQWQSATSATGPWTNVPGATSLNYTTPPLLTNIYYRVIDTCNNISAASAASTGYPIAVTGYPMPYIQNFDSAAASNAGLANFLIPHCMVGNYNAATASTQTIFSEGFDGTAFPPTGWITGPSNGSNGTCSGVFPLKRCVSFSSGSMTAQFGCSSVGVPASGTTHNSSAGMIGLNSWFISSGYYGTIISPAINMASYAGGSNYQLSFWVYGESGDPWNVSLNTSQSATGATSIASVSSSTGLVWTQHTYTIPASFLNGNMYIIIQGYSNYGDDIFFDDVSVTYLPVPRTMFMEMGYNNTKFTCADGTVLPWCVYANDTTGTTATNGKLDYLTTPALPLVQGINYRVRFGYGRGTSNWTNNTGTPPNTENLYLMAGSNNPGTASSVNPVGNFPNPQIWSGTAANNTYVSTTSLPGGPIIYSATSTGPYFFSWIDNTPHSGATTVANGTIALDSIRIDSVGCVLPSIVGQPAPATSVCAGFPASFSVVGAGYGLTYQWYRNGSAIPGASASSYTIGATALTDSGLYTVAVIGACGGTTTVMSTNDTLRVVSSPPASITAGGPTTICPGNTVPLNANVGSGYTYQWSNNNGIIAGATSPSYSAGLASTYKVTVSGSGGCYTTSAGVTVVVNAAPPAVVTPGGSTTLCQGSCVSLSAGNTASQTYQWNINGTAIPGATGVSYSACVQGTYTVTITNTNNGCTATSPLSVPVIVNPLPSSLVTGSGVDTFCQNGSVTFVGPANGGVNYQWYNGLTPLANQTTNTYIATNTGLYYLKVTNLLTGCSSSSTPVNVLLNVPSATVTAPTTSLCNGNSVTLTSTSTGSNLTYQWYINGYAINLANAPTYTTNTPGNYTVTVTSTVGQYSCSNTSTPPIPLQIYSPPPAYITTNTSTTFCAGSTVLLTADTGTGYTYQWQLNGNNIPQATVFDLSVPSSGNYSVKVTNAYGCSAISPATTVTVIPLPVPIVTASGNTQLCPGSNVTLSTSTAPGLTYQWYNGTTLIPGATFPVYVTATTANYTVVVTNNTGCQGTSNATSVVMNAVPSSAITATGATSVCSGTSVLLSAAAVSGLSYQWLFNGNAISGANSSSYSASTAGNYTVTVTNVAAGCTSTTITPGTHVTVFPLPSATSSSIGATSVCEGTSVILLANTGTGLSYQWNNSGTPITSATHLTDTVTISGSYTVTVTDANNCSATSLPSQVTIYAIPVAGMVPAGDTGFCQGGSVLLSAVAGAGYTYQWIKNGVNIAGAVGATYLANQQGVYSVLETNNICGSTSPTKNVVVYPQPSDLATLLGADTICYNDSVQLQATATGSGYTYQWEVNGSPITGATHSALWAQTAAGYAAVVTSNYGCAVTTQSIQVYNFPPPNPGIIANGNNLSTGTFVSYQWYRGGTAPANLITGATGNGYTASQSGDYYVHVIDDHGCGEFSPKYTVGTTGVANVGSGTGDVKIYPNPATTIVYIEAAVKVNVKVSDLEGKALINEHNAKQIDISNLANGVYMISVYDNQGGLLKVDRLLKAGQ